MSFLSEKVGQRDWIPFFERFGFVFKGRGDNRLIVCPFTGERSPSFSINVTSSLYKCHGSCQKSGDAVTYLVEQGRTEHEAIDEIKAFFQITDDSPAPKKARQRAEKVKTFPQDDPRVEEWAEALLANPARLHWLLERRGINEDTVRSFKIGFVEGSGRYSFPVKTAKGLVAVKLYLPDATKDQVKWIHAESGSEIALYPERRISSSERIVIGEGELDVLLANQMGIAAVTGTGGAGSWKAEWSPKFKDKSVVIVYDNDEAGDAGALKVSEALIGHAMDVTIIKLPLDNKGGDLTDYFLGSETYEKSTVEDFWAMVKDVAPKWERASAAVSDKTIKDKAIEMRLAIHPLAVMSAGDVRVYIDVNKVRPTFTIGEQVWSFLTMLGAFYIDASMAASVGEKLEHIYFFNKKSKALWPLASQKFEAMLFDYTQFNVKESDFSKIMGHLQGRCVSGGAELVSIYKTAYYDEGLKKAYVYRGQNRMFVLDGDKEPYETDNGDDGILFADSETMDYWHPDFDYSGEPMLEMFSNMRLENTELTDKQMQLLLTVYTIGMIFPTLQPTRLIPMFIGEMGSGKTYTSRMVGWLWCGVGQDHWDVSTVEENREEDFITTLARQHIICADNLDNRITWMQDLLARVATGAKVTRRALYTNGRTWSAPLSSWLMITSREPKWIKREDVVQRLLPIHFKDNPDRTYTSEKVLSKREKAKRSIRMGNLLRIANGVVKQIRDGAEPTETSLRIADFAFIGQLIANAMGQGEQFKEAVTRLPVEQRRFMSHDHPMLEAIEEWLEQGQRGRDLPFEDFFKELQIVGGWNDRRGMRTWKGLLEKMKEMKDTIEMVFGPFVIERQSMSGKLHVKFLNDADASMTRDQEAKVGAGSGDLPF